MPEMLPELQSSCLALLLASIPGDACLCHGADLSAGRYVYDGELEGQMTFLLDTNKRLLKVSDIYPEEVQLAKGDYIIRAQLRHDNTGTHPRSRPMHFMAPCSP
jgi:hypothetical protein